MKIGDRIYVHGYVDEIRKDCVIVRNNGGYFGTVKSEIVEAQETEDIVSVIRCKDCKHWQKSVINYNEYVCYWGGYVKKEDDYCSWGKRKEE